MLASDHKTNIAKYVSGFKEFMLTSVGKEWQSDRERRKELFTKIFDKSHIDHITEDELKTILKELWATKFWGNKEYYVSKIVRENGLERLKEEIKQLLYGTESLRVRYDRFRTNIKGLGISSISEILLFTSPNDYCLWNKTPINVLPFLGMKNLLPNKVWNTYSVDGEGYEACNQVMKQIADELRAQGFPNADLVDVDFFLCYILNEILPKEEEMKPRIIEKIIPPKELPKISTHEEAEGVLLELGNMLGFETYVSNRDRSKHYRGKTLGEIATLKEIPEFTFRDVLDVVREIDVIWFKSEGYPEYCFEVEHTTNVRDGLLRLFQISPLKGVKFFVIAPSETFPKFQTEVSKIPFSKIKDRYNFKSYEKLIKLFGEAEKYHALKKDFGLD
jgi:hypothetical protein